MVLLSLNTITLRVLVKLSRLRTEAPTWEDKFPFNFLEINLTVVIKHQEVETVTLLTVTVFSVETSASTRQKTQLETFSPKPEISQVSELLWVMMADPEVFATLNLPHPIWLKRPLN